MHDGAVALRRPRARARRGGLRARRRRRTPATAASPGCSRATAGSAAIPSEAVDLYTRQCSLAVTRARPRRDGRDARRRRRQPADAASAWSSAETAGYTLAVMTTAGLYETSGDWLYDVGLPGKSGIGGGIVTVAPGKGGLGTFAPPLDEAGNSVKGQLAARFLSRRLGLDLFASEPVAVRRLAARAARGAASLVPAATAPTSPTSRRSPRSTRRSCGSSSRREPCGPGEPYEPMDVDALFDEPTVALRGPWNATDLVKIAPVGEDLAGPLRLPPRLPGQRARPGLRLREAGRAASRRARGRRSTRTSPPRPAGRASSRSSTGSSTPTTTGTTCTRATGR